MRASEAIAPGKKRHVTGSLAFALETCFIKFLVMCVGFLVLANIKPKKRLKSGLVQKAIVTAIKSIILVVSPSPTHTQETKPASSRY